MGYDGRCWYLAEAFVNDDPRTKSLPEAEKSARIDSMAQMIQYTVEDELEKTKMFASAEPLKPMEVLAIANVDSHALTPGCSNAGCRGCQVCDTRHCRSCGLTGASLTTDCCGQEVTAAATEKICEGKLDYRGGQWVAAKNPAQQEMDRLRELNRNSVRGGHAGAYR